MAAGWAPQRSFTRRIHSTAPRKRGFSFGPVIAGGCKLPNFPRGRHIHVRIQSAPETVEEVRREETSAYDVSKATATLSSISWTFFNAGAIRRLFLRVPSDAYSI